MSAPVVLAGLPRAISSETDGWEAEPLRPGRNAVEAWRLRQVGRPDRVLKRQPATWDRGLDAELARLEWLEREAPLLRAPRPLAFAGGDVCYLLTTALDGVGAADLLGTDAESGLTALLGQALRELHRIDPGGCPFDAGLDAAVAAAVRRVGEGRADGAVLAEIRRRRPPREHVVVTHGDFCLPSVLVDRFGRGGLVELASMGLASRWRDLAVAARSLRAGLGEDAVGVFLHAYGIEPDAELLAFYELLDDLV